MKAFEVLKKIVEIIQKNLSIAIYDTFCSNTVKLPIMEKFLTIEIFSGNCDQTLITLTCYTPQAQGASVCRNLTKKTIEILNSSKLENLNDVAMQNVIFDKAKKAYTQKCKLTFKLPKEKKTPIIFGDEEIFAKEDLSLKFSRNISIYYSQLSGVHFKDLGKALRKVTGSATVKKDQFLRLADIISKGTAKSLTVKSQTFNAILTSLERKSKEEIVFNFLEIP